MAGVFSPPVFNSFFEANNIACRMDALEIPPAGLGVFLELLRHSPSFAGCSITYPHKQAAFARVDGVTDRAARLGAINTIRRESDGRLSGDATDGAALVAAISASGFTVPGATARLLGAGGGAGLAITDALCSAGLSAIVLEETDEARATQVRHLVNDHGRRVEILPSSSRADILINATTLGKSAGDPCPFAPDVIASARVVCDVVSGHLSTPLIDQARESGRIMVTGADMGANQIAPQLGFLNLLSPGDMPLF